ncbi:MOSC domain-containing protein [Cryptosporangium arvum]|uniref:MOSC domain-containing protein n=1 Tax=Cryptosporangium arvum TaxID=80871 RepID=UPI0004B55C48|nr:MOSC domain-containing protein [Cryptosporangium arvum]
MSWHGTLLAIYTAEMASVEMTERTEARLLAGVGIEGDRYATGRGHYSYLPHEDRQVTLIEQETLDALERDHQLTLRPEETRRNLLTRDVPLNHLIGRQFRVGEVVLYAGRLNVPCTYLEDLLDKPVFTPLINRSGLNCRIVTGGVVRPGDVVEPV